MTLANVASQLPAWYELLHQVGLERRRNAAARAALRAGWFGLGLVAGGGLAVLLTPRSGPEVRQRLGRQARRARDYVASETDAGGNGAAAGQAG